MSLSTGRYWDQNFEVVVGSSVNLNVGDEFMGVHGLLEDGSSHEEHKYNVVGILKPSGTVIDRLILTSLNSVLDIHGLHKVDDSFKKIMNINTIMIIIKRKIMVFMSTIMIKKSIKMKMRTIINIQKMIKKL